jgi:hypothetical protein
VVTASGVGLERHDGHPGIREGTAPLRHPDRSVQQGGAARVAEFYTALRRGPRSRLQRSIRLTNIPSRSTVEPGNGGYPGLFMSFGMAGAAAMAITAEKPRPTALPTCLVNNPDYPGNLGRGDGPLVR